MDHTLQDPPMCQFQYLVSDWEDKDGSNVVSLGVAKINQSPKAIGCITITMELLNLKGVDLV
jgi:stage V sporulation protein SpoVS